MIPIIIYNISSLYKILTLSMHGRKSGDSHLLLCSKLFFILDSCQVLAVSCLSLDLKAFVEHKFSLQLFTQNYQIHAFKINSFFQVIINYWYYQNEILSPCDDKI